MSGLMQTLGRWTTYWHMRARRIWWIVHFDSTAFAEVLSGAALLILRGLMLLFVPRGVLPLDVLFRLEPITENRWATYIMVCGMLQILLAGSRHSLLRVLVKVAIVAGLTLVAMAYVLEGKPFAPAMLGLVTVTAFYLALLVRLFRDRSLGVLSLDERVAALQKSVEEQVHDHGQLG